MLILVSYNKRRVVYKLTIQVCNVYHQEVVMLLKRYFTLVFLLSSFSGWSETKLLSIPQRNSSLETIERGIISFSVAKDKIVLFPDKKPFLITHPYFGIKDTRENSFGKIVDGKRIPLPSGMFDFSSASILSYKDSYLVLEGELIEVSLFSKVFDLVTKRSVAWNIIKPPMDRNGEATAFEIARMQALFAEKFKQTNGWKYTGLTQAPVSWPAAAGKIRYLIPTRMPKFPLLSMVCDSEDASQCVMERACYARDLNIYSSLAGIAVSQKRNLVLVGDESTKVISLLRFDSCYSIKKVGEILLPERIKSITDVQVDEEDGLCVSSREPDDYDNASLYRWSAAEW
jgi:hypothetical protein